jgi:SAM-dependent methyltransferase
MEDVFFDIFKDLPRQGPGNNLSTKRAIDLIKDLPAHPTILDIGSGTGTQTFQLAHHIGGSIYALDKHAPYLDQLMKKADRLGYSDCIQVVHGDMAELEFEQAFFDLIWAEGSIYIMGFEEGLNYLMKFLKPLGYLAVTEISWLEDNQPEDLMAFWEQEYNGMNSIQDNLQVIAKSGYRLIDYFILAPVAWWDGYYSPLENRLAALRKKYLENDQALELIEFVQLEIDLYRKYPEYYGYVFYIMQKP